MATTKGTKRRCFCRWKQKLWHPELRRLVDASEYGLPGFRVFVCPMHRN